MVESLRKLWANQDLRKKLIYTFGMLLILSGAERTSTLISSHISSSGPMGSNRGSWVDALTALLIISFAMFSRVGRKVPIHPRSFPSLWMEIPENNP